MSKDFYPKKLEIKLVENKDVNPIKGQLRYPAQLYEIFKEFKDRHVKTTIAVFLSADLGIIVYSILGQGNDKMVHFSEKELFGQGYVLKAEYFVLMHNSPNGNPKPTINEIAMMSDLQFASKRLKLAMLDYIIIGDTEYPETDNYWSLAEQEGNRNFGDYLKGGR